MTDRIQIKTITAEDVEAREQLEQVGREIINGEWAEHNEMAGEQHNIVSRNVLVELHTFAKAHRLGRAYGDNLNYVLDGTPQNILVMRIPDVSFVAQARLQPAQAGYLYLAPDLAVEVVSPSERKRETEGKIEDYLHYGTQQVWVIFPEEQRVVVHHPDHSTTILGVEDTLTCPDILPGFALEIAKLFEE